MFLHKNDQKMVTFHYFGPRILFVRPERTVGNNGLRGTPPKKTKKKSLFQFLLNLKLENICELMQKTASPYLFPFQNYGRMKLTCTDILLYKNGHFLRQIRV